jgi:hypothetical protein
VLLWGNDVSLSRLFWSLTFVAVMLAVVEILKSAARGTTRAAEVTAPITA